MIYLGSDHNGHDLKQEIARMLEQEGRPFSDLGDATKNPDDDYPDFAFAVGEAVAKDPGSFGILACGSAQGVCIAANKVKGVRAVAVMHREDTAKTREDDDANVLCLSGWRLKTEEADGIVEAFLATPFSNEERHRRRIGKISSYESR